MPDVFTFINDELSEFTDNGIYDSELRHNCLKLNELLNFVDIDEDYDKHLDNKAYEIQKEIERISISINEELFVDLSIIVSLLCDFQRYRKIKVRDHFYHSIQCFLLAIALISKFKQNNDLPQDIIAILYSLTMFHDIGYLYRTLKTTDNESISNLFRCTDDVHAHNIGELLCLPKEIRTRDSMDRIVTEIRTSEEIKKIWELGSSEGQDKLEAMIEETLFTEIKKEGHAYYSALLLAKAYRTKNLVIDFCKKTQEFSAAGEKNEWFKEVMKAVCLHGLDSISPPLSLKKNFYSAYLMIIDELQTYGRKLSDDTDKELINPNDVGFSWNKTYPDKLEINIITTNPDLMEKCSDHSYDKIFPKLSRKINKRSLPIIK